MRGNPTVVLSQELWSKISRLHTYAGSTEWSGPIYYEIKGNLKQPDNMVMNVKHLILKNVGSGAYTEYEFGPEMIDLYEDRPELMTMPMGHLHTHHNMGVFFSGTDMSCLHDNAPCHDMFLSVIVNTQGHKIAKLAVIVEIEQKVSFKLMKKLFNLNPEAEQHLAIFDCNVIVDGEKEWKVEFDTVLKESKAKMKRQFAPQKSKNYLAPVGNHGQLQMYEPPLYSTDRDDVILELSDANIENLIVRSLSIDELESRSLKDVIPDVRQQLPDGDQSDMVSMMVDHFEYALREEYKYGQFDAVIDRCKQLLSNYRNFRYINQFLHGLDDLGRYYTSNFANDTIDRDTVDMDRDIPGGGKGDYLTFSEIEEANEF